MRIEEVESYGKYLSPPTIIGKSKRTNFASLQDKLWRKIKGWKEKYLSQEGREVLIKTVTQAILNYVMSCFKILVSFCTKMESMLNNFWWGDGEDNKKIHWFAWDIIRKAQKRWGIGVLKPSGF